MQKLQNLIDFAYFLILSFNLSTFSSIHRDYLSLFQSQTFPSLAFQCHTHIHTWLLNCKCPVAALKC